MSWIDAGIIIVYLIAMLVIGFVVGKDNASQEDYFLAGRSMPWLPVALSVAATMISANSFIGGSGWAYTEGLMPFMQNITVPLACFLAVFIAVPVFYHLRVSSVYEYMELRMGKFTRLLTVAQFFINSLIQVSSMVYIPALIIQTITGWSLNVIVPLTVLCAIIYTVAGGIKAVIWTDAVQMVVLWGGLIFILIYAMNSTGLGFFTTLGEAHAAGKFNAFDFSLDVTKTNCFLASCFGIFQWVRYFCFDQAQVQRILTSKSMRGIKRSFVSSSIIMNLMYFLMLFVGCIFFVYYGGREFATSNEIMIGFMLDNLPVGVLGLVIAAVFAAAMSSVDSLLNSMTTVFTKDIYEQYFAKEKGKTSSLRMTMTISVVLGIFIILIVMFGFTGTVASVIDVVGRYISYFSGPALASFLLAMFTTRASDRGTAIGFLVGIVSGYLIATTYNTSWLINPAIGCAITLVVSYALSFVLPREKSLEDIRPYTVKGLRAKMIAEHQDKDAEGVSLLPFHLDQYGVALLVIFAAQYVILALIR
ncbi:MAG TPA: sodium/solute symporter [Candidatus Flavonifractor intestinipullorum]|uniref:Sodium/solute symporter n=1 Tax=Candidatus Flavonifractor intestinipullorum TaxID=2838587 RepID=A0A9D2S4F5_9FIRM|nr:sodium/solute symporter [Candidatus Flavonifractor intestinipullorum]